jgi:autotransporter-associated beta strand protein
MPFRPLVAGIAVISCQLDRLELEGNRSGASALIGAVELSLLVSYLRGKRFSMKTLLLLGATLLSILGSSGVFAGSATWNAAPGSRDWNTAANWTPASVPNGPADVATFGFSSITAVTLSASTEVSGLVFNPGAASYSITPTRGSSLTLSNTGIENNSGQIQSFTSMIDVGGRLGPIVFTNGAAAGSNTAFANQGGAVPGAETDFLDTSTADHGTFTNFGGSVPGDGGQTRFFDSSTAGSSVISNQASLVSLGDGGHTNFFDNTTADKAVITNAGGLGAFLFPGTTFFNDSSSAGESTITSDGADAFFGVGAEVIFDGRSSAGSATVVANGGTNAGATTLFMEQSSAGSAILIANGTTLQSFGGLITFVDSSIGGMARVEVFGIGALDISARSAPGLTIGSLEGDGLVHLGANKLVVGSNNLSVSFGGVIDGTGSLTKTGRGKLTLTGLNAYSGGTTIMRGAVLVTSRTGSATGNGPVQVNRGLLGGAGRITGPVTIGNGTAVGASLAPGTGGAKTAALSIQGSLTFRSLGEYKVTLNSTTPAANEVAAKGVTIESGATVSLQDIGAGTIASGTVLTILSNTSANLIEGTFANLADGSTISLNGNNFVVSYEGGDGNDLTLTVL